MYLQSQEGKVLSDGCTYRTQLRAGDGYCYDIMAGDSWPNGGDFDEWFDFGFVNSEHELSDAELEVRITEMVDRLGE